MFEVNVRNKDDRTFKGVFKEMSEAKTWIQNCVDSNTWGLPEMTDEFGNISVCEYIYEIKDITEQVEKEKRRQDLLKAGDMVKNCCTEITNLIGGYNLYRNLTAKQITEMIKTFAEIDAYLSKNRPFSAKEAMLKVKIDGEIVTQELYDIIMDTFKRFGI